jgi:cobalamin biosynthesis protein CobD/CbiB
MYSFIFYYIYCQQINKEKSTTFARLNGAIVVFMALCFHIGVIIVIIEKYFSTKIRIEFITKNKFIEYGLALLFMWLLYKYYAIKRVEKIKNKYDNNKLFNNYGGLITVCLIFIPLAVFIFILS